MNLVVNLAAARDNGPFSPGPDKNTVFPNDFLVDYVRVWKPMNDPNAKQAEKWQIPVNQKPINAENSTSRIKRKVRHVYSKKKLKSESGFISLIPQSEFVYLIQYNGSLDMNLQAELVDQKNISKQISVASNKIDLSGFPKGDYLLKIQSSGLKTQISIKI
jgi:hypothetical protein